jgi:3-hydroxyisobutyrate dehydrogenase-like beta-hydroxyacid dehydrogenase
MTLGFIGLGRMGGHMCRHLIAAGSHEVVVHDLSADAMRACTEAGARGAASIAELAGAADVIFSSLPMPADVETVALGPGGIRDGARQGTVYFDLSTSSPELSRRVGAALGSAGITMLDAPVSGGPTGAEAGTLGVMVGGPEDTFDAHLPLLETFAGTVVHVGDLGSGLVVKLVNNLLAMASVTAACEGLMLAAAAGIDLRRLDAAIRGSTGDSLAYRFLADRAFSGDYTPAFTMDLAYKDIHLALELADQLSVPTPMGGGVHDLMRMAKGLGLGDADPTAVMRVYETTLRRSISELAGPASAVAAS